MSLVFGASALLGHYNEYWADTLDIFEGNYVLELTLYEIGDAEWKEAKLLGLIGLKEAVEVLNSVIEATRRCMRIIEPRSWQNVLSLAYSVRLTFYDAAYVVAAAENRLVLVTDDRRLPRSLSADRRLVLDILGSNVEAMDSATLLGRALDKGASNH